MLESRLDSYTSTPVRSRFAWYIATSARRSSPSASSAWSGKTATPALASRTRVSPSRSSGEPSAATRSRATRCGGRRGVGDRQQHGELVAAEPRGLRAARQRQPQPVGYLQQQPVAGEVSERVIDRTEPVEVDQHQGGTRADALGVVESRPGPLAAATGGWAVRSAGRAAAPRRGPGRSTAWSRGRSGGWRTAAAARAGRPRRRRSAARCRAARPRRGPVGPGRYGRRWAGRRRGGACRYQSRARVTAR